MILKKMVFSDLFFYFSPPDTKKDLNFSKNHSFCKDFFSFGPTFFAFGRLPTAAGCVLGHLPCSS